MGSGLRDGLLSWHHSGDTEALVVVWVVGHNRVLSGWQELGWKDTIRSVEEVHIR
jgi:hypothetical protein